MTSLMKKAFYFFAAAVAAMAASCTQEIAEPSEAPVAESGVMVFKAYTETGSKTFVGGAGGKQIYWESGDKLSLFCGSDSENHVLECTVPQSAPVADFTSQMSGLEPDYLAIYPYSADYSRDRDGVWLAVPVRQAPYPGTYDPASFISIAKSSNQELRFYNLCGGFRIRFSREGVNALKIKSNNGETLAGYVKVALDDSNHPYVADDSGNDEVNVYPPAGSDAFLTGVDYYVSLLPGVLSDGVSFTLYIADGMELGTSKFDGRREIRRSVFASPKDFDEGITLSCPAPNAVDLGLSVQWADCNLGASAPADFGYYFAWGETLPKSNYSWDTYKWGTSSSLTKYTSDGAVLEPGDDAATALLGESWRTPTSAEIQELIDACNWSTLNQGGQNVIVGTSKADPSKSITLPLSGWMKERDIFNAGKTNPRASLWASDLPASAPANANEFFCAYSYSPAPTVYNVERCYGLPVRPVYSVSTSVSMVKLDRTELSLYEGASTTLAAEVIPSTALNKALTWTSDDNSIATVSATGKVTAVSAGSTLITVSSVDGGHQAYCTVTVQGYAVPESVDLGLSVRWASFNLGGTAPAERGPFFSWGETAPKDVYDLQSYIWKDGYRSGSTSLLIQDDAAAARLGGYWRMPTMLELKELADNCTWTTGSRDGVAGVTVSSKKPGFTDKSIFLPFAGILDGQTSSDTFFSYIWASEQRNASQAWTLMSGNLTSKDFYKGLSIRPVYCDPSVVGSVLLNIAEAEIEVGQTVKLTATVRPSTAADKSVTWTSSDPDVATVDDGLVLGKGGGTAVITATTVDGNRTASCTVTVKSLDIQLTQHNAAYWFKDVEPSYNTVRAHVAVPDKFVPGESGNSDVKVFSHNLLDDWTGYQVNVKLNGSIVTDGSVKTKFVFGDDQPAFDGYSLSRDGNTLLYRGDTVANITPEGVVTLVWKESPYYDSMILLNKWSSFATSSSEMFYCNVDLVAYREAPVYAELCRERIHVRFLRPVNIDFITTSSFQEGNSYIRLGSLFTAHDWNGSDNPSGFLLFDWNAGTNGYESCYYPNASSKSVYWYYYYGISMIGFDIDGILSDQTGSWRRLSEVNPNVRFSIEHVNDPALSFDASGGLAVYDPVQLSDFALVYKNPGSSVGGYNLKIPMAVTYAWGVISGELTVPVEGM